MAGFLPRTSGWCPFSHHAKTLGQKAMGSAGLGGHWRAFGLAVLAAPADGAASAGVMTVGKLQTFGFATSDWSAAAIEWLTQFVPTPWTHTPKPTQ